MVESQLRCSFPLDPEDVSEEAQDLMIQLAEERCGILYSDEVPKPRSPAKRINNVLRYVRAREEERETIKRIKVEGKDIIQDRRMRAAEYLTQEALNV